MCVCVYLGSVSEGFLGSKIVFFLKWMVQSVRKYVLWDVYLESMLTAILIIIEGHETAFNGF